VSTRKARRLLVLTSCEMMSAELVGTAAPTQTLRGGLGQIRSSVWHRGRTGSASGSRGSGRAAPVGREVAVCRAVLERWRGGDGGEEQGGRGWRRGGEQARGGGGGGEGSGLGYGRGVKKLRAQGNRQKTLPPIHLAMITLAIWKKERKDDHHLPRGGACARATTAAPTSQQRSLREGVSAAAAPSSPRRSWRLRLPSPRGGAGARTAAAAPSSPRRSLHEGGGRGSHLPAVELARGSRRGRGSLLPMPELA
jgi:hypothetical protein